MDVRTNARSEIDMPTPQATPRPNDDFSLAISRLRMQTTRSNALYIRALGLTLLDALLVTILVDTGNARGPWIAAIALLGLSLALAVLALRLPGAERIGPSIASVREARKTQDDRQLQAQLLADLISDLHANERALARKAPLLGGALILLALAIAVELAGRLL
jgi:hypothetical protein